MQIQNEQGQIRHTTVDPSALVLEDMQQGDVFSFMNDATRRIYIMGEGRAVIDINANNVSWNDEFIDSSRVRVVWYPEARLVLGREQEEACDLRGTLPTHG